MREGVIKRIGEGKRGRGEEGERGRGEEWERREGERVRRVAVTVGVRDSVGTCPSCRVSPVGCHAIQVDIVTRSLLLNKPHDSRRLAGPPRLEIPRRGRLPGSAVLLLAVARVARIIFFMSAVSVFFLSFLSPFTGVIIVIIGITMMIFVKFL